MACKPKEDHDAQEATYTRRDRGQVTPGRCTGRASNPGGGREPRDWVTEVTDYRWRQEYGGLKSDQIKRMKELETENARLRKAIADLTLDKLILQEAARGNF